MSWWRDEKWNYSKRLIKSKPMDGYHCLSPSSIIDAKLNKLWRLASKQTTWLYQVHSVGMVLKMIHMSLLLTTYWLPNNIDIGPDIVNKATLPGNTLSIKRILYLFQ